MRKLFLLLFISLSFNVFAQKEIKLTSDIQYDPISPSCVLDVAEPVGYGSEGLRPAIVIIHG